MEHRPSTLKATAAAVDNIFEDFNWEKFGFDEDSYTVSQADNLADYALECFADDYMAYILKFDSVYVPVKNKLDKITANKKAVKEKYVSSKDTQGCERMREKINCCIKYMHSVKDTVLKTLKHTAFKAESHKAPVELFNSLVNKLNKLKYYFDENLFLLKEFQDMEDITASLIELESAAIKKLMLKGIDAKTVYTEALVKIADADYEKASRLLRSLDGFKNSREMLDLCNHMYLYEGTLEFCHDLYHIKTVAHENGVSYDLYNVVNNLIGSEPILTDIKIILSNYGNRVFYISALDELCFYDFRTAEITVFDKKGGYCLPMFIGGDAGSVYILQDSRRIISDSKAESDKLNCYNILEIDLITAKAMVLRREVAELCGCKNNYLFFKYFKKNLDESGKPTGYSPDSLNYMNIDDHKEQTIAFGNINFKTVTDSGEVVFTKGYGENQNLYAKNIIKDSFLVLLERNIYQYLLTYGNKIFYYVGSNSVRQLFSINADGSERACLCRSVRSFEGVLEDKVYALCDDESGRETLYSFDLAGGNQNVISKSYKSLLGVNYGDIFYINKNNSLMKAKDEIDFDFLLVRNIERFVAMKKEYIYYLSVDGSKKVIRENGKNTETITVPIKSLYRVRQDGQMIRKLAYDIISASWYDENHIDYRTLDSNGVVEIHRIQCATLNYQLLYREKHIEYSDNAAAKKLK